MNKVSVGGVSGSGVTLALVIVLFVLWLSVTGRLAVIKYFITSDQSGALPSPQNVPSSSAPVQIYPSAPGLSGPIGTIPVPTHNPSLNFPGSQYIPPLPPAY